MKERRTLLESVINELRLRPLDPVMEVVNPSNFNADMSGRIRRKSERARKRHRKEIRKNRLLVTKHLFL